MPRFIDDVSTPGLVRATDALFSGGVHGTNNFDSLTGLRKAQSGIHEIHVTYRVASGVAVATIGLPLFGCEEIGEVVALQIVPEVLPTLTSSYIVDLLKGNAATPYATVLSSTTTVDSSSAVRTPQVASIDSTKKALADGDSLKLSITAATPTGVQGTGLAITLILRMRPQA